MRSADDYNERRQFARPAAAWPYVAIAICVEYLLLWEFRSFFIELGRMWIGGAR
jgi:hypothetical protein